MSFSDGAFEAALPVAAHMPGGGSASINLMLAVRMRLDAVELLVDVRGRCFPFGPSRRVSGCGNGTGVEIAPGDVEAGLEEAMTGM